MSSQGLIAEMSLFLLTEFSYCELLRVSEGHCQFDGCSSRSRSLLNLSMHCDFDHYFSQENPSPNVSHINPYICLKTDHPFYYLL